MESICDGTSSETPSNSDLRLLTPIIPKGSSCPEAEELLGDMGDVVGSGDNRDPEANATWEGRSFTGETAADPAAEAGSAGSSSESDSSSHWPFGFSGELTDLKHFWDFVMKARERMDKKEVNTRGEVEKMVTPNNRGRTQIRVLFRSP